VKFADVVVFVVGSKLSTLIARYEPYKLEKVATQAAIDRREARRTKASIGEETWLLKPSVAARNRREGERASDRRENDAKASWEYDLEPNKP